MTVQWRFLEHNLWTSACRSIFDWGGVIAWAFVLAAFAFVLAS